MAKKRLFVLGILVVLLAVVAVVTISLLGGQELQNQDNQIVVAEINSANVDTMVVTRGDATVSLVKQNSIWHDADNTETSVDQLLTESALTYLSYVYASDIVSESVSDKTPYGLDPAQMEVNLHLKSGETHTYRFGIPTSDNKAIFLQKDGDPKLYLFGMEQYQQIISGLDNAQDLSLGIDAKSLASFSLVRIGGQRTQIDFEWIPKGDRVGTEQWRISAPFNAIASPAAVELVQTLFSPARLASYVSDDIKTEYGIDTNSARLTMEDTSGNEVTLTFGNQTDSGSFYCTVSGITGVYTAYQGMEALLKMETMNAVSPNVFHVSEEALPPLTLMLKETKFALTKQEGQYVLNGKRLSNSEIEEIVKLLQEVTLDGPAADADVSEREASCTMGTQGTIELGFSTYNKDYFAVSMKGTPFGYIKMERLAILADGLANIAG